MTLMITAVVTYSSLEHSIKEFEKNFFVYSYPPSGFDVVSAKDGLKKCYAKRMHISYKIQK